MPAITSNQAGRTSARQEQISQQVEGRFVGEFSAAERILGVVELNRDAAKIEIGSLGEKDLLRYIDTRRAPLDDYQEVDLTRSTRAHDYGHYGLQATRSVEAGIFEAMRQVNQFTSVMYQILVAFLMKQSQEVLRIAMLIDPANWPTSGHAVDLTGLEWNSGSGDIKGNVEAGLDDIHTAKNLTRNVCTLWLPYQAFQAAIVDPGFVAAIAATASPLSLQNQAADAQLSALQTYLGVDIETDFFGSHEIVGGDGATQNAWADNAILYVDHRKTNLVVHPFPGVTTERLGAVYKQGAFAKTQTFLERRNNSMKWRRDAAERSWLVQDTMGVLFHGVSV